MRAPFPLCIAVASLGGLVLGLALGCTPAPRTQPSLGVPVGGQAACYDQCMADLQKSPSTDAKEDPATALATCRAACGADEGCAQACAVEHTASAEEDTKQDTPTAHGTCTSLCGG
jgi:hypothetical protein